MDVAGACGHRPVVPYTDNNEVIGGWQRASFNRPF